METGSTADGADRERPERPASTWAAVAWAEGLLLVGLFFFGVAIVFSIDWSCLVSLGCERRSSTELGPPAIVAGLIGAAAVLGAAVQAARHSDRPPGHATIRAIVAFLSFWGVLAAGDMTGSFALALVLALGALGGIAIRAPSSGAVLLRIAAVGLLFVLAVLLTSADAGGLLAAVVVLTVPAIGIADAVALRRAE